MHRQDPRRYTQWSSLRDARLDARLTCDQLGALTNRSRQHIQDVERGRVGASEELLFKLADVLGVRPSELARTRPAVPPQQRTGRQRRATAVAAPEAIAS